LVRIGGNLIPRPFWDLSVFRLSEDTAEDTARIDVGDGQCEEVTNSLWLVTDGLLPLEPGDVGERFQVWKLITFDFWLSLLACELDLRFIAIRTAVC
jgi:hypothetical protein